ncbi:MAG: amidohydrolase [Novosphingobium sp.]|nr:amidohydrolase [Novosphingobium sp.]
MQFSQLRAVLLGAAALALTGAPALADSTGPTVYTGGTILTMRGDKPELVEAVAVRGGTILAVGSREAVEREAGRKARHVDLAGKAMLPGFIDAHGHVSMVGRYQKMADLSGPPLGKVSTIAALQDALRAFMADHPEGPIAGRGYDDAALESGEHPTRRDLDAVSSDRPIAIMHVSGHLAVANSAMLALAGVRPDTPDPEGGVIRREDDGKTPNGVLEEGAIMSVMGALLPRDLASNVEAIIAGLDEYVTYGITTAQEGGTMAGQWPVFQAAAKRGLPIDLVMLTTGAGAGDLPPDLQARMGGGYEDGLRVAGLKFVLDGSPQGRTAWLSRPYHVVPEGKPKDYRGYPGIGSEGFETALEVVARHRWQVFAHVNGDAALDQLISGIRESGLAGNRTVAIHNQVLRPEQLAVMRELDIQPSFFANHTYFWGDWHRDVVLGPERGEFISPQASAWRAGLTPTAHNDAPIVPPDIMRLVWSSVNRRTLSGDILGAAERISPYRALQQVTINAAWQIHEESAKGSIAPGKQADFAILAANPLTVDPAEIHSIAVVATINDGKLVFGGLD